MDMTLIGPDDLGALYAPPTERVIAKQIAAQPKHQRHDPRADGARHSGKPGRGALQDATLETSE
jgi:hypothetical protein